MASLANNHLGPASIQVHFHGDSDKETLFPSVISDIIGSYGDPSYRGHCAFQVLKGREVSTVINYVQESFMAFSEKERAQKIQDLRDKMMTPTEREERIKGITSPMKERILKALDGNREYDAIMNAMNEIIEQPLVDEFLEKDLEYQKELDTLSATSCLTYFSDHFFDKQLKRECDYEHLKAAELAEWLKVFPKGRPLLYAISKKVPKNASAAELAERLNVFPNHRPLLKSIGKRVTELNDRGLSSLYIKQFQQQLEGAEWFSPDLRFEIETAVRKGNFIFFEEALNQLPECRELCSVLLSINALVHVYTAEADEGLKRKIEEVVRLTGREVAFLEKLPPGTRMRLQLRDLFARFRNGQLMDETRAGLSRAWDRRHRPCRGEVITWAAFLIMTFLVGSGLESTFNYFWGE